MSRMSGVCARRRRPAPARPVWPRGWTQRDTGLGDKSTFIELLLLLLYHRTTAPDRITSPYTTIVRRSGNPFELAHVCVSWLVGAGYDACVAVGAAKRDTCMGIRYRTECPDVPDETEKITEAPPPEEEPRYRLQPLPDLSSKYVQAMEEKELKKKKDEQDRVDEERRKKIEELESPPPDAIDGWRIHAWVIILPGAMGVEVPFFIEPQEGNRYEVSDPRYQRVDCIYNHENYYVNLQNSTEVLDLTKGKYSTENVSSTKDQNSAKTLKSAESLKSTKDITSAEAVKSTESRNSTKGPNSTERLKSAEAINSTKDLDSTDGLKSTSGLKSGESLNSAKSPKPSQDLNSSEGLNSVKDLSSSKSTHSTEGRNSIKSLDKISYDVTDLNCWEHLLAGEPFHRRQMEGVDYADKATAVETDKHLDMPASWVEKLDISTPEYYQRYPGSHKVIHYKKVLLEKFSRYSERDGIVKRVKIFADYALDKPLTTYEYYDNRVDLMEDVKIDYTTNEIRERFRVGRKDHIIKHTYAFDARMKPSSLEVDRVLEFNYYARLDHLNKIVCSPLTFDEYFTDREDRLQSRQIVYTAPTKSEPKRQLLTITETYSRNPDVAAEKDVWKRIFYIQENTIELLFHYAYNFVTNYTRNYIKPNIAETGGDILFYPERTSGYIADPTAKEPRPLHVYYGLCENMEWENESMKNIRDRESDIIGYLKERNTELTEPQLYVSLFDTEKNEAAKIGWKEQEMAKAEVTEREKEAEIDPLAPYLARMFGSGHGTGKPLTFMEATLVREQCLNDFKSRQLMRQNIVMERFEKMNDEYKTKKLWYLANQFILTPAKESHYFTESAKMAFEVHNLEVRLTRHRDLSGPRYKTLVEYLDRHPLLVELKKKQKSKIYN
ncbi:unnamed protein product [Plutella xylostella]|uniref:(diamondback moth) hypothetical protein n=1 Tax=Plutella xylostella TaxID=51655 RepID=A0A8S4FME3_PLUXY|nr:unnamed protein product [Plutella xylostella]